MTKWDKDMHSYMWMHTFMQVSLDILSSSESKKKKTLVCITSSLSHWRCITVYLDVCKHFGLIYLCGSRNLYMQTVMWAVNTNWKELMEFGYICSSHTLTNTHRHTQQSTHIHKLNTNMLWSPLKQPTLVLSRRSEVPSFAYVFTYFAHSFSYLSLSV